MLSTMHYRNGDDILRKIKVEKAEKRFYCQICGDVMVKPIQTFRGNGACYECYYKNLNSNGTCPIDGEPISLKQVFQDKAKEREIQSLQCICTNEQHGCTWSGTVAQLQKHICEYEAKKCQLCNLEILVSDENNHFENCPAVFKIGECFFKGHGCTFKAKTNDEMSKHIKENAISHTIANMKQNTALLQKYDVIQKDNNQLKDTVDFMNKKLKESEERSRVQIAELTQAIHDLAKRVQQQPQQQQQNVVQHQQHNQQDGKATSENVDNKIKTVVNSIQQNTSNLADLDLRLQLHENSIRDGHLVWKIDNFQRRQNEAITGKITALHSSPCFTSQYGYKFCLRLYLNGDGMGKGSHLSLFLVMMKSEYDNILEWPFTKKVKFTLMNQQNRTLDVTERMVPNKDSSSFQKPKKEMNIASGCPLFVRLDRLERDGFVKDDSLFIDVEIV